MRRARRALGVRPVFKRVDTCAAEFASPPPTCTRPTKRPLRQRRMRVRDRRKKAIILGGGPNRIGQGIEFDYCCCHAAFAFDDDGFEAIMVNCNPETVSTDYDTSDRLYFEPLTDEDVLEILTEVGSGTLLGVIVQFGGQTPLKLADALEEAGIPILGTAPDMIDLAEDRDRFQKLLHKLDLRPAATTASPIPSSRRAWSPTEIGFPLVVRPSYVLGGRAMQIIRDEATCPTTARHRAGTGARGHQGALPNDKTGQINTCWTNPLLFDRYLTDAIEVDVDCLCDGETSMSPASWSTSRKPACTRATAPARCRPYTLSAEMVDRARGADRRASPGRSMSAA